MHPIWIWEMDYRSKERTMSNTQMTVNKDVNPASSINLIDLSEISGVPLDYIKSELLINDETEISLGDLRQRMLKHIDEVFLNQ